MAQHWPIQLSQVMWLTCGERSIFFCRLDMMRARRAASC